MSGAEGIRCPREEKQSGYSLFTSGAMSIQHTCLPFVTSHSALPPHQPHPHTALLCKPLQPSLSYQFMPMQLTQSPPLPRLPLRSVALHSYLPNICVAAAHNAALARDCIAGEVAAWQRLPCHLLLPVQLQQQQREQRQRRQTSRQQQQQEGMQQQQQEGMQQQQQQQQQWEQQKEQQRQGRERERWDGHAGTGEDARDTARSGSHLNDQVPRSVGQGGRINGQLCMGAAAQPLLVCQGRALPLLPQLQDASTSASGTRAGAGTGAGGAAAGEGMGIGAGWGAVSEPLPALSSRGGGALFDSGSLALGHGGSGGLPHTPGVGGSVAGRLALLLHAASEMDSAAALKCPYSLPALVAGMKGAGWSEGRGGQMQKTSGGRENEGHRRGAG